MNYAGDIDRAINGEQLALALSLAEQWVATAPEDAGTSSKLAHVHEMDGDFSKASSAVSTALKISPDYPPYLFKKGYAEYRLRNYADAADAFALCVARFEVTHDHYYLDAARIAQARSLVLDDRAGLAVDVIASVAVGSATWLDKRFSKEDVLTSIPSAH